MLKPFNKYTARSENVLFKTLCKENFAKVKLNYCRPHLHNKFIAQNNDLLEAVAIDIFKLGNIIFSSTETISILIEVW